MASVFVVVAMALVFYLINKTMQNLKNGQYFYVKWQYQLFLFIFSNYDVWVVIHFQF